MTEYAPPTDSFGRSRAEKPRASTRSPSFASPSRSAIALAVVLRLLSLLVVTELSGAAHALLDVAARLAGTEHPHDDCDDEEAGHECPPGCPNCHCAHGAVAQLAARSEPRVELEPSVPWVFCNDAGFVPRAELRPQGADRTRLYRPPRAVALS